MQPKDVAQMHYVEEMATTTVRLDAEDERILDQLAAVYGGRSKAIRHAIRSLAGQVQKQESLAAFVEEWDREVGPADEAEVAAMINRFNL
jgi:predicted transcriptional regulator